MSDTFQNLFLQHAIFSFDRQLLLADRIGNHPWNYNKLTGELTFGKDLPEPITWHAGIVGTEATVEGTWLWAWANQESNIPAEQLTSAQHLKAYGEEHQIREFTEPLLSLEEVNAHAIAAIAVGFGLGRAYYLGPYGGGSALLLIDDPQLQLQLEDPLMRMPQICVQAIQAFELTNHRLAVTSYFRAYQLTIQEEGNNILAAYQDQPYFRAEFDSHNRLTNLQATYNG
ncbi:Hypothetical protein PBC10988_27810 [Planctomycetales bacterium 10988]|nr:Hypothetical protein PBC10988_27810 [Planctomycetales bacterium 10988]